MANKINKKKVKTHVTWSAYFYGVWRFVVDCAEKTWQYVKKGGLNLISWFGGLFLTPLKPVKSSTKLTQSNNTRLIGNPSEKPPQLMSIQSIQTRLSNTERVVDNPGGGHCMFYAASLALARIVQQQAAVNERSVFDRWQALDPSISYEQLLAFNTQSPSSQRAYWDLLQRSLRNVLATSRLRTFNQLRALAREDIPMVELCGNNPVYLQFREFCKPDFCNRNHDNLFAGANIFNEMRAQIVHDSFENQQLAQLFFNLLQVGSPLYQLILNQANSNSWGTYAELEELAYAFNVNLATRTSYNNGAPEVREIGPGLPTVSVFNHRNNHWLSILSTEPLRISCPMN